MRTPYRHISLLLTSILLVNPVVFFLRWRSVWLSVFLLVAIGLLTAFVSLRVPKMRAYYFNFVFLAGLFIHAEAVFTFAYGDYIIRDLYNIEKHYYFNRPLLRERFVDKEYAVDYVTNGQGYRIGAEDDPSVELKAVDWLFLGDSYTQGAQVDNERLYTSLLYRYFPDRIILNAGISGFGIADEYHYFKKEGRKLNPKKVFLQICNFNDFMKVGERTSNPTDYLMNYSNLYRFLVYPVKFENPAELPLGRWTEPFYPDDSQNADYNVFYKPQSPTKRKDLRNFEAYLSKLNEAVQAGGGELIVVQLPTKEQLHFRYFDEVVREFKLDVGKLDMMLPNKILRTFCKKYGIRHLDLFDEFSASEDELYYEFDEHLNARGHEGMANALAGFLSTESAGVEYVSRANAGDRYPNFSGDGKLMCYQSIRDGNSELFLSDVNMENGVRLTYNRVDEAHPAFFQNDTQLIFTEGDQADGRTRIATIVLDGLQRSRAKGGGYGGIAIPSGENWLSYAQWQKGSDGRLTNPVVCLENLLTKRVISLTSPEWESWRPVYSNNKVVYISKREGAFDLYLYDLKQMKESRLTFTPHDEWDPNFSPDGREIVYSGKKDGNWDLFRVSLVSGKVEQLTRTEGDEWDAVYSPDGRYIYYAGVFGLRNGIYRMRIPSSPCTAGK